MFGVDPVPDYGSMLARLPHDPFVWFVLVAALVVLLIWGWEEI
jgi:hypothetical protein